MFRDPSASSLAIAMALALVARPARAGDDTDKRVCLSTYVEAQAARQDGKLRTSEKALLQCARAVCPAPIRNDCVRWLREVTDAMPTVVLSATGPDGHDRPDVRVSLDGQPLVSRLDGRPLAIDPGEHLFRFESDTDGAVEERVVVREGEHDRAVTGVFPRASPAPAQVPLERPVPTAAWVLGGVGATSLLVSATFATLGWFGSPGWISSQSCRPSCSPGDVDTVHQRFVVADISGAIALASLGSAAYVFFSRPEAASPAPPPVSITVAPRAAVLGFTTAF